jgi:hypothetical protein
VVGAVVVGDARHNGWQQGRAVGGAPPTPRGVQGQRLTGVPAAALWMLLQRAVLGCTVTLSPLQYQPFTLDLWKRVYESTAVDVQVCTAVEQ